MFLFFMLYYLDVILSGNFYGLEIWHTPITGKKGEKHAI